MRWLKSTGHRLIQPKRYAYFKQLLRHQKLSPEQLIAQCNKQRQELLQTALKQVPYYRQMYADCDLNQWEQLPILTKQAVHQHREQLLNQKADRRQIKLSHTGGSTGQPLAFYYHPDKIEWMRAGMMRSYTWSGWQPGEKIINLWGAVRDVQKKPAWRLWLKAEKTLAAYHYNEAQLYDWFKLIRSYRPVLLQGYASILNALAEYMLAENLLFKHRLKGVYSTAEMLTDPMRHNMEKAFNCTVFNQYGSREVPNIAVQCAKGKMHVLIDLVHLESVFEKGVHRLLLTGLTDATMPFIRYANGDLGRMKFDDCSCGLPFPLMSMDLCRQNDLILSPRGYWIYPAYFVHLLDGIHTIKNYQFIQSKQGLTLNINGSIAPSEAQKIMHQLQHEHGLALTIQCNAIHSNTSGKHRFVFRKDEI